MAGESRRGRYEKMRVQLSSERSSFIPTWRDCGDYILPRRVRLQTSDVNRGDRRNQKIIDSTATLAARTLRSGMMSGITSPARPWFRLSTPDPAMAEFGPVKDWLHIVTQRMSTVFLRSNVYNVKPIIYGDMGVFGTAAMFLDEDFNDVIRAYPFPLGSYMIANDHRLRVNTFMREYQMTVRQIVQQFGSVNEKTGKPDWTNISLHVRSLWDTGQYETRIDVIHAIKPNDEHDRLRLESKYKKFSSVYYETGAQSSNSNSSGGANYMRNEDADKLLLEKGYDYFPVLCPRWETSGEDTYGTSCPGMDALGDIKQLQLGERRSMQAIEKMINPPMRANSALQNRKTSLLPGDVTFLDNITSGQVGFEPIHEVNPRIQELEGKQNQVRSRIQRAFFEDLFLMLQQADASNVTAREIDERHEEKLLALGPVLEQLNQDFLDPEIDITFQIMLKQGLIPPPPQELSGMPLKVEYISFMAQAQKSLGLAGMDRFSGYAERIIAANPESADKLDFDQMLDIYADITGVAPATVRSDDAVEEIRAGRAQQTQMQNQMAMAQQAVQGAKDLSQTNMQGDNALTRIVDDAQAGSLSPETI